MILLVHGWGFDATLWDGVRAALPPDVAVEAVDLGFFGEATTLPDRVDLAVGHSLGALFLLTERPDMATRLVLVNGFPRFTAAPDFPFGVAPRVVERMARRLKDAPAEVVDAFRDRCGDGPAGGVPDLAQLAWGLDLLRDGDGRAALPGRSYSVIAGTADPIVPPAMTEAAFGAGVRWLDGGHLLPLTHPQEVAAAIMEACP